MLSPTTPTTLTMPEAAEVLFDVQAAIQRHDLKKVWDLVPLLSTLNVADYQVARAQLRQCFGADLQLGVFDRAVRQARKSKRSPGHLPTISAADRTINDVTAQALEALYRANQPPTLFKRSGTLVYLAYDESNHRPLILDVGIDHLRGRLDRAATWTNQDDKIIPPNIEIVRDILALPCHEWKFPELVGIVEAPTVRRDGTIISQEGYDPASQLYYIPTEGLSVQEIPDDLMQDDAQGAAERVRDVLADFPFVDAASYANTVGLLLTPMLRPILRGCAPMAVIDAPEQGTGKTLLVQAVSTIVTGQPANMQPLPKNEIELQKVILSTLLGGKQIVCFDNVAHRLDSPSLAITLTTGVYEDRVLGVSKNAMVPNLCTWIATGNNVRLSGDMPRRCYHIRLDAQTDKPYQGRTFRYPDLLGHIKQNRAELLWCLLVMIRSWFAAGRPAAVDTPLGSFELWHKVIGGILTYAGIDGFMDNADSFRLEADDDHQQWRAFLEWIWSSYRDDGWTVADLVGKILLEQRGGILPDSVADLARRDRDQMQRVMGRALASRRDRRFGLYYLKRHSADEVFRWVVMKDGR